MWAGIGERHGDVHAALIDADDEALAAFLSNPGANELHYGFDRLCRSFSTLTAEEAAFMSRWAGDALRRFAEALDVIPTCNPESALPASMIDTDALVAGISAAMGHPLHFPTPFQGEVGLPSALGYVSMRAVNGYYQAHRLAALTAEYGPRILEIGAGLGRTAYAARQIGLGPYFIVDIPMTNVAQGMFLGLTLPAVRLCGEIDTGQPVALFDTAVELPKADVVLNADSLTELDRDTAERYVEHIRGSARAFLSINHESNPFRVSDLGNLREHRIAREPYWLRPGYVLEVYEF